jgi:hypothetical protein
MHMLYCEQWPKAGAAEVQITWQWMTVIGRRDMCTSAATCDWMDEFACAYEPDS